MIGFNNSTGKKDLIKIMKLNGVPTDPEIVKTQSFTLVFFQFQGLGFFGFAHSILIDELLSRMSASSAGACSLLTWIFGITLEFVTYYGVISYLPSFYFSFYCYTNF